MNSMAANLPILIVILVVSTPGSIKSDQAVGLQNGGQLIITAKPGAVRGSCNAVRCPDVQYKLVTTDIIANTLRPNATPSELSILQVCGPSSLQLGAHYKFVLRDGESVKRGLLDQPMAEGGESLPCDYIFNGQETAPAHEL